MTDPRVEDVGARGSYHNSRSILGRTVATQDDSLHVLGHDLVLNGVEIATGGIKEHHLDKLLENWRAAGIDVPSEHYGYYIDALKNGAPPMLNSAVGWDRLLSLMLNTPTIHDVMFLPKDAAGRCQVSHSPTRRKAWE